jgi:hypothetical protein
MVGAAAAAERAAAIKALGLFSESWRLDVIQRICCGCCCELGKLGLRRRRP